mmetsp:Transcript_124208/g.218699  ORF Transcript_124208/g.218699 Transcript_124208/m.218699 type:complete len:102 (-) Transcript_124208:13-318(-)
MGMCSHLGSTEGQRTSLPGPDTGQIGQCGIFRIVVESLVLESAGLYAVVLALVLDSMVLESPVDPQMEKALESAGLSLSNNILVRLLLFWTGSRKLPHPCC